MRTLYVSDLDGTLLASESVISDESIRLINQAISRGIEFTVATGRAAAFCVDLISPLNLTLPVILMNGVFLYDLQKHRYLLCNDISADLATEVLRLLDQKGINCFLYQLIDNDLLIYHKPAANPYETHYIQRCQNHSGLQLAEVSSLTALSDFPGNAKVAYITVAGEYKDLAKIVEAINPLEGISCALSQDAYIAQMWNLEIFDAKADKKNGVAFIKNHYGFDQVCVFGDNSNDIGMFQEADFSCAMENAVASIKSLASCCIGSNKDDSVAKWLNCEAALI
jgi:5-amino-6-(5-phospho-D-ribitylamino)uracil phosphatase